MKAIVLQKYGGVDNLKLRELSMPRIRDDEILIKTKAISINPLDVKTRSGEARNHQDGRYNPIILGCDSSGTIVKIGASVKGFEVGQEVFGVVNHPGYGMVYAEYLSAPVTHLAVKPSNISHEEAAAATLSALTAWQAMTKNITLNPGSWVLIHAASGGVGHFAVQIAKYLGACVIGTSSAENKDFVLSLGADEHIDYQKQIFEAKARNIDFVLDTIGGQTFDRSLYVLVPRGTIVTLPAKLTELQKQKARQRNVHATSFTLNHSDEEGMKEIAGLLEKGIVKSHVSKIFEFADMAKAHLQIETGKTVGKIIIRV